MDRARSPGLARPAPVEEVDPVAGVRDDDEAGRLGSTHPRGYDRRRCRSAAAVPGPPLDGPAATSVRAARRAGPRRHPVAVPRGLAEVAIVIDDEPTRASSPRTTSSRDDALYGLYEGVPRTEYGADWVVAPNRITLFRLPLEEDFPDPDELADEVRITVIHELAHHLGIDDDRLDELGVD